MKIDVTFSGANLATFVEKVAMLGADAPVEMARGLNDAGHGSAPSILPCPGVGL